MRICANGAGSIGGNFATRLAAAGKLVTMKSSGQPALAEAIGPRLRTDTSVAFVENGIPWWYGHGLGARPAAPDLSRLDPGRRSPARSGWSAPWARW